MNYLLYIGPGIGDFMLALPTVQKIKKHDKNSKIDLLITSDKHKIALNRELLKIQDCIEKIYYYNVHEFVHSLLTMAKLIHNGYHYGIAIQYTNTENTSSWPSIILNLVTKRTGGISNPHNRKIKYNYEISFEEGRHITEYNDRILKEMLKIEEYNIRNLINFDTSKLKLPKEKKSIAIILGTGGVPTRNGNKCMMKPAKNWFYDRWLELAELLEENFYVYFLGGRKELNEMKTLGVLYKDDKRFVFMMENNILNSIAVLSKMDLVIGADTGMMHCAGVMNIPSLTLFGCTDYREYLNIGNRAEYITANINCSPCFGTEKINKCTSFDCMKSITVKAVYEKIIWMLKDKEQADEY